MLVRTNKPPESTSNTTSTNDITQQSDIIPNEVNVIAPNNKQTEAICPTLRNKSAERQPPTVRDTNTNTAADFEEAQKVKPGPGDEKNICHNDAVHFNTTPNQAITHQWPLLLTWFNFNPSMDK